ATDLADYLAKKGLPFREAHGVVGRLVKKLAEEGRELESLSLEELRAFSPLFEEDALWLLRLEHAIHARTSYGGTAPEAVRHQLEEARARLAEEEA
ncbi:MAG TPA: argininosuccinate lyase, partial [Oceanithermus sp.]|nr:argininosuccinate lyase [Oceanithermus sp.]